jgi:hypothetical protein
MKNTWKFTQTLFDAQTFLANTGNHYRVVAQQPYLDRKGTAGCKGTVLTLTILEDSTDYGADKETGVKRDNNQFENFDVTILNGQIHQDLVKGDFISLEGYDQENSYVVGFDLILRFKGFRKENKKNA